MLVITRKLNDSIIIELGDEQTVEIKVTDVGGSQVRLGITAPKGIHIWRKELYATIQANRAAAQTTSGLDGIRGMASALGKKKSD